MSAIPATPLPSLIDWPRDEGAHTGPPWEIWWITAKLRAGERNLAAHVLFYHPEARTLSASATITDLDRGEELSRQLLAQPEDSLASRDELRVETALCSFRGSFVDGYRLTGDLGDGNSFDLALTPTRPVLHNGGSGQYVFQGVTTTQYSVGFLHTSGQVRLGGETLSVSGDAWYDRQWDHWARTSPLAFTWFGVCLTNGDTLSVFDTTAGPGPGHKWATIVRPDGTHIVTAVELSSADARKTPSGRPVPQRWTLTLPSLRATLELTQQTVADRPQLYTGVLDIRGSHEGHVVGGYGFCDLTGPAGAA